MQKLLGLCLALTVLTDSGLIVRGDSPVSGRSGKGRFTISKETTYVTGPVDKDGYIDYAAALNERLRQGVTPENNANVLIWKALGPHPKGTVMPPGFFEELGMKEPPEKGDYFLDCWTYIKDRFGVDADSERFSEFNDRFSHNLERAWSAEEHRDMSDWLKQNEKPLSLIIEATKRSHYYRPSLVAKKESPQLVGVPFSGVEQCRRIADALAGRAMLRLGEKKYDDAWQDLLACHRLARIIASGPTLLEGLVGVAMDEIACKADLAYLEANQKNAKRIESCLYDLQELPALPVIANKADLSERFAFLDTIMVIDRKGIKYLTTLSGESKEASFFENFLGELFLKSIDWDPGLRTINQWCNRMAEAERTRDREQREKKWSQIEAEVKTLKEKLTSSENRLSLFFNSNKDRSKFIGDLAMALVIPAVHKVQHSADRDEQVRKNLGIAFALVWYHSDHGNYPKTLDALAPKYLKQVPQDIFSGKPLIYRLIENGYVLYSVGINGKDDEGRGYDDEPRGDDLVIRMPLPELKQKQD